MLAYLGLIMAVAGQPSGDGCMDDRWRGVIGETASLIERRASVVIPPDGLAGQPLPACVRLTFDIDGLGRPTDIDVNRSSKVYPLDRGAVRALEGYRFKASSTRGAVHALVFTLDDRGVHSP